MIVGGFEFPEDLRVLVEHDVWARLHEDGSATVGITALGVRLSGEIYMCRPKPIGTPVQQGRSVAVVELAKAIVSVKSPVNGTVVAINPALAARPELVHQDPYGEGWIARLALDGGGEPAGLLHGAALLEAITERLALERLDPP
jgi:glycine cleavage system H protein